MLKKIDYIIILFICVALGVMIISHYRSGVQYQKLAQPESNAILAVEVAKLEKNNSDLRQEVKKLTKDLETYGSSSESEKKTRDQYSLDSDKFDLINGLVGQTGQGIIITIENKMVTAQTVDLTNALKNIGANLISINGGRIVLNTDLSVFANQPRYEIKVLGNSSLLKSAMERKGGIVDQISTKDLAVSISEQESITIAPGQPMSIKEAKILIEQ